MPSSARKKKHESLETVLFLFMNIRRDLHDDLGPKAGQGVPAALENGKLLSVYVQLDYVDTLNCVPLKVAAQGLRGCISRRHASSKMFGMKLFVGFERPTGIDFWLDGMIHLGRQHFFFYCNAHTRDLHSFPTRRSSD